VQCTSSEYRESFLEAQNELIFAAMEAGHQQYESIVKMPVQKLNDYLKWKTKLEKEKEKLMDESQGITKIQV
jgi:hypothetical protein